MKVEYYCCLPTPEIGSPAHLAAFWHAMDGYFLADASSYLQLREHEGRFGADHPLATAEPDDLITEGNSAALARLFNMQNLTSTAGLREGAVTTEMSRRIARDMLHENPHLIFGTGLIPDVAHLPIYHISHAPNLDKDLLKRLMDTYSSFTFVPTMSDFPGGHEASRLSRVIETRALFASCGAFTPSQVSGEYVLSDVGGRTYNVANHTLTNVHICNTVTSLRDGARATSDQLTLANVATKTGHTPVIAPRSIERLRKPRLSPRR